MQAESLPLVLVSGEPTANGHSLPKTVEEEDSLDDEEVDDPDDADDLDDEELDALEASLTHTHVA